MAKLPRFLTSALVLSDCKAALELLEGDLKDKEWRVIWTGALALLRSVGHVLHSVDARNGEIRSAVDHQFERWKSDRKGNAIYWDFIKKERDLILKEYRSTAPAIEQISIGIETHEIIEIFELEGNLFREKTDGFRAGEDARDIYRDAIFWWEQQLEEIENTITAGG